MGSLELRLLLRGAPWEGVQSDELQVRVCERGLRVASRQRVEASQSFLEGSVCGDFVGEVLVDRCWWKLEVDADRREYCLVVHLAKAKDGSWPRPFREGPVVEAAELSPDWRLLRPGAAGEAGDDDQEDLGVGIADLIETLVESQTEDFVTLRLFLKQSGLDKARSLAPMSRMWALDLTEDHVKVALRSRGGTVLLSGRLGGRVQPAQTDWSMVKVTRGTDGARDTRPALEIQLLKAPEYRQLWDPVLIKDVDVSEAVVANGFRAEADEQPVATDAALGALDVDHGGAPLLELDSQEARAPEDHARALKAQADACFQKRQWEDAADFYGRGLAFTPNAETLLSNRSAALMELKHYQAALDDAMRAAEVAPAWPKSYFRQGIALRALKRYDMAVSAFSDGFARDPGNPSWQREIKETEAQRAARLAARAARR